VTDDNINVTNRDYMNTTDNNLALLQDLYLCVSATRPKNMDQLLNFLEDQMDIEQDVWEGEGDLRQVHGTDSSFDIDDLHDPEFNMRNYLNG